MTPESEGLELIAVGSLNAAIFHPQWFLNQKLIGEQEAAQAEVKVVSSQVSDIVIGEIHIVCVADRLSVATENIAYAEKVHDLAIGILALLPHTPLRSCGINPSVHYRINSESYWHKIGHALAPKDPIWKDLYPNPGMRSLSIISKKEGDFTVQTTVIVEPSLRIMPGLFILANHHFDVPDDHTGHTSSELIRRFIESEWNAALADARRVAKKIFESIQPDQ